MNVYVAYIKEDNTRGWIMNPQLYFEDGLLLVFGPGGISVGLDATDANPEATKWFKKALVDKLDSVLLPWTGIEDLEFVTRYLHGSKREMCMANIRIVGPLPNSLASRILGTRKAKASIKGLRYGG